MHHAATCILVFAGARYRYVQADYNHNYISVQNGIYTNPVWMTYYVYVVRFQKGFVLHLTFTTDSHACARKRRGSTGWLLEIPMCALREMIPVGDNAVSQQPRTML